MSLKRRILLASVAALILAGILVFARSWQSHRFRNNVWLHTMQTEQLAETGGITYRDVGSGSPAVVIINGMAVPMNSYAELQRRLSWKTRVIAFDRPGIGESTPNSEPRTLEIIDKDIEAVLAALQVPPPYVLVGHSLGGFIIRYYAAQHPEKVAGLVFLDAPHEDWFRQIRATWSQNELDEYFRFWTPQNPSYSGTGMEEMLAFETNSDLIRGTTISPSVPVLMFTGSNDFHFRKDPEGNMDDFRAWVQMQTSLLEGVKDHRQIVDKDFGHFPMYVRPGQVSREIASFIDKLRKANPPSH